MRWRLQNIFTLLLKSALNSGPPSVWSRVTWPLNLLLMLWLRNLQPYSAVSAGASRMSASLVKISIAVKAKSSPKSMVSICITCRGLTACGIGPLCLFFFHLERMTYFSARISYIFGTERCTPCSFFRKYWIFWPQQSYSRSLISQAHRLTIGSTCLFFRSPFLACLYLSRKPIRPAPLIPLIHKWIVSRCFPSLLAIRVFGIPCS